ncbi:mechanosensitive ion channel family protein [Phycicoccus flavus]|uniref:mechanosensitive ion channel family protein n=1 Tax=Phycicoccus flavus TaxID=2502783 RepID=UPI000FEBA929|nr:mechanosensitive ion channel domain-containing protein [Phycicoccus flavus]NHA67946.1 mechanosensitive ion channel [Phycicoccus flavus]
MSDRWIAFTVVLVIGLAVAATLSLSTGLLLRLVFRRRPAVHVLVRRGRLPLRLLLGSIAVWVALATALPVSPADTGGVPPSVDRVLAVLARLVTIGALTWFVAVVAVWIQDRGLARNRVERPDNRTARRVRTQMMLLRRLTVGGVVVVGLGAALFTLPGVRALGASVLASAGVVSIIAGLAAQSTLGNVIAGIQIALSDSVRFDDAVIVEDEWGWVEEITLTYVVVRLWDDRRLVLPSTWFTTQPFQNWTRNHSELLGSVELDLDWRADVAALREHVREVVGGTELWDGRVAHTQVTDAVGGTVHVRVLVTARDAPTLFDLRCHVREELVAWVRTEDPDGLPRTRVESVAAGPAVHTALDLPATG